MIPPSISRPFGRSSPRLSEIDLARLIDRTIALAVAGHHEQGWAATSIGCDGRKRTTLFDGSVCQTDGEVCIATRQDGISACIEAPTQGNGLTVQSISFRPAACAPVTGWWLLDEDGYLYRVPTDLTATVDYWPPAAVPSPRVYDLIRSGTWARLMCAAALADPANNGLGGSAWSTYGINEEDSGYTQFFRTMIGGTLTCLDAIPTLSTGSNVVHVGPVSGHWEGVQYQKLTTTNVNLNQSSNSGVLTVGQEYKSLILASESAGTVSVYAVKGNRAAIGTSVAPVNSAPLAAFPICIATTTYSSTGGRIPTIVSVASLVRYVWGPTGSQRAIVLRDGDSPNPGVRSLDIALPAGGTGVVTGPARIAFGYPVAVIAHNDHLDEGAPWPIQFDVGQLATRDDYDMAFVYGPPRLAVEYGYNHVNLAGPDILDPGDSVILSGEARGALAKDVGANLLALPNGEIGLDRPYSETGTLVVPQRIERFRVRPAPDTAPTLTVSQQALGAWGDDSNAWLYQSSAAVSPWLTGATTFTRTTGSWTHGRDVPCVLWHASFGHWSLDPTAQMGTLQSYAGPVVTIDFGGGGAQPCLGAPSFPTITVLGAKIAVAYGWTFTLADGTESALSPISEGAVWTPDRIVPATTTYTLTVGVPVGPDGTASRSVYRFAYEVGWDSNTEVSPWHSEMLSSTIGALYDRMLARVGIIAGNVVTEWVDTETTLSYSGTRPPLPFIPVPSGIVVDAPGRPFLLPPLDL